MSHDSHTDETTPGERLDQRERHVLHTLITDPFPWTLAELQRVTGKEGRWAEDAIIALDAAGLVHRFIVRRLGRDQEAERTEGVVIPTGAARCLDELQEGAL